MVLVKSKGIKVIESIVFNILNKIAAFILFSMMLVTLIDVVGRNLLSRPLSGGFEITEMLLASLIFLGLPMVTLRNEYVCVDLIDSFIPKIVRTVQDYIICLFNIFALGVMSWMQWKLAIRVYEYQDTTAILEIPYIGLVVLMATCSSISTLIVFFVLILRNGKPLEYRKMEDEF